MELLLPMASKSHLVVLTTCASAAQARRIARALIEARLAACVNIILSQVESVYRWKGKVEKAREFLLVIKTSRARFSALERTIRALHSYDVPEIIALPLAAGSRPYLQWLSDSLKSSK